MIYDKYKAEYDADLQPSIRCPVSGTRADVDGAGRDRRCARGPVQAEPRLPAPGCRAVRNAETRRHRLLPPLPAGGKPGSKTGCQPGDSHRTLRATPWTAWRTRTRTRSPGCWSTTPRRWPRTSYLVDQQGVGLRPVGAQRARRQPPAAEVHRCGRARRPAVHRQGGLRGLPQLTPLLSDSKFHNVGVSQVGPGVPTEADCPAGGVCDCVTEFADHLGNNCLPWGATDGLWKLKRNQLAAGLEVERRPHRHHPRSLAQDGHEEDPQGDLAHALAA